jgi:hypothetical protein
MTQQTTREIDIFARPERIRDLPRYRELSRLDAYFRGVQYDGRPDWWSGVDGHGEQVPLRERKPCVIYPLPKAAVNQATRFIAGEGRFPQIKAEPVEVEDALSPEMALSEDEAETLTKLVREILRQVRLKSRVLEMLRRGLSSGTVCAIVGIRRGKFVLDLPDPKDCFPRFKDDDVHGEVEALVWSYCFERTVEDRDGNFVPKTFHFRRDVTADEYVVYEDAPKPEIPGQMISWTRDETRTKKHGLGFCPALWIRNQPETSRDSIDGVSLYEGLLDEFDALNFALSQRHRGIHYLGTPQVYETGVSEDENPAGGSVRGARSPSERTSTTRPPKHADAASDPVTGGPFGVMPKNRRAVAPDRVLSYKSEGVRLGIVETTGAAFDATSKHVADVRSRILEAIDVVLLDPTTVAGKGEISAKALAILFAPLLALVDELREQWWEDCLERLLATMLRTIAVRARKRTAGDDIGSLLLPGVENAAQILDRFWFKHEGGEDWIAPRLTPIWGDYFSPSNEDVKAAVDAADAAKQGGLIRPETATRHVASYFGVDDPAAEAEHGDAATLHGAKKRLNTMAEEPDPPESQKEPGGSTEEGGEKFRGAAKDEGEGEEEDDED